MWWPFLALGPPAGARQACGDYPYLLIHFDWGGGGGQKLLSRKLPSWKPKNIQGYPDILPHQPDIMQGGGKTSPKFILEMKSGVTFSKKNRAEQKIFEWSQISGESSSDNTEYMS